MSVRAGFTINGSHFRETYAVNGRRMFFVDGKIASRHEWQAAIYAAKAAEIKAAETSEHMWLAAQEGDPEALNGFLSLVAEG